MSLRRRKRLQNRAEIKLAPATRTTRFVLATPSRGLRTTAFRRPAMPRTNVVLQREFNPFYLGFNRDVRHLQAHRAYIDSANREPIKKPLSTIGLDGTIITDLPRNHPICVLRRQRRELMFATGKAGHTGQRRRRSGEILRCE